MKKLFSIVKKKYFPCKKTGKEKNGDFLAYRLILKLYFDNISIWIVDYLNCMLLILNLLFKLLELRHQRDIQILNRGM